VTFKGSRCYLFPSRIWNYGAGDPERYTSSLKIKIKKKKKKRKKEEEQEFLFCFSKEKYN
jgi:hypothetical protein